MTVKINKLPASLIKPKRSKYGNKPCMVDGKRFPSHAEAGHYTELKHRERLGEIMELQTQVPFKIDINGFHITTYLADFVFWDCDQSRLVVQDKKGGKATITDVFRIKQKLMRAVHNIEVEIV